ncbi:hypothetical protein [Haloarchaeobius sp. DFWS5]|uniref:hypothetical protein n=1 Tax=Haloarchaeobius sp. DFWS5 TaxID=3446114 RepID=UPI003EB9598F
MKKFVPLALVALVCLSGCAGVIGDDSASAPTEVDPTATTSAPTEVDPADADLPPGVNESGVTNASVLVSAHEDALQREGFVMRGYFVVDPSEPGSRNVTIDTTVAPGGEQFEIESLHVQYPTDERRSADATRIVSHIWGNSSTIVRRYSVNGTPTNPPREIRSLSFDNRPTKTFHYQEALTFGNPNFTVDNVVTHDGHTFTTLVADGTFEARNGTGNVTARFVVDERGIIHESVIDWDGGTRKVHHEYQIVKLGPDPPEAPAWTDDAVELETGNTSESGTTTESLVSATDASLDSYPVAVRASVAR